MGRIRTLRIQNFRGLVDVGFSPRRINILVGRNNSGKSSVLEALALLLCSRNGFLDSGGNDLWRCLTRQRYYDPRFLINTAADRAVIEVSDDAMIASLALQGYRNGIPDTTHAARIMNYYRERVEKYLGQYLLRGPGVTCPLTRAGPCILLSTHTLDRHGSTRTTPSRTRRTRPRSTKS